MRLDELTCDLNSVAVANGNHFVANTRLRTTGPGLLVYSCITFPRDLPETESGSAKFGWQRLIEPARFSPTFSRSARFRAQ
jgi:hypothetical protein